jgi:ABC-2 type transport system ATP-binding protein
MEDIAIRVDHVGKSFRLPHEKQTTIKGALINRFKGGNRSYETQEVLKDISFNVKKGEFFGIVGRNGSGKSTLLKMLAGIYTPTHGSIQVNGALTPFIELGVGFNPELTGRENVFLNGALLGFNRREMEVMYKDIVTFAELEKFMDQKLKNYSSGMQVRLAFSIAIRANSPILLLDEVLAVGDALFQKKCFEYFKRLKREKKTVILVSHDAGALEEYCTSGILLEKGAIIKHGKIDKVIASYRDILNASEEALARQEKLVSRHDGVGGVDIESVKLYPRGAKKPQKVFTEDDKLIEVRMRCTAGVDIEEPIYGLTIYDAAEQRIFAGNNLWSHLDFKPVHPGQKQEISWIIPNVFSNGSFTITVSVATDNGTTVFHRIEGVESFKIDKKQMSNAYTNLDYVLKIVDV